VGRERLSLESSADRGELARRLLHASERPVAWCVLDRASERTAALADLLAAKWGPGLCYQSGVPWADGERRAVLPRTAASRMLRAARTRVWWSERDLLDGERVMESLEHGCLPLQFTQAPRSDEEDSLSEALYALLLRADRPGSLVSLNEEELQSRLQTVATALAAGQLEGQLLRPHG
jgi:hypothetical protein